MRAAPARENPSVAPGPARAAAPSGVLRDSPLPLHFQVRNLLLAMIERGELQAGRALPPERALARQFGVSLAPVRQAMVDLAREGVLYRVRGRGTFLLERALVEHDPVLASFSESMSAKGLSIEMQILRDEKTTPGRDVSRALQTTERRLYRLERLALVDGEPAAILTSHLSPRRFPDLSAKLAELRSLYRTLEGYGVVPVRADTLVEVGRCTTTQAALLGVPAGSAALEASGTTYDAEDQPVEQFHVMYRPDRVRLRLQTHRYVETVVGQDDRVRASPSSTGRARSGRRSGAASSSAQKGGGS